MTFVDISRGSMAFQNANNVAITGGTIGGTDVSGGVVPIVNGNAQLTGGILAATITTNTDVAGLSRSRIHNRNNTAGISRASLAIGSGTIANKNGVFSDTTLNTSGVLDCRPGGPGLPFIFQAIGTTVAQYTSARWTFSAPIQLASYTLATLPIASTAAAQTVYCSNLTGGAEEVFSDGTNWLRKSDRTIAN